MIPHLTLRDAYKKSTHDQDKILSPEETVRRFREKLSGLNLDILAETVRIDNGRLDIPVFFSRCGKDARRMTGTSKQMGKGATPAQAEASAVMELAERFSFFSFCNTPEKFITGSYGDLRADALPFDQIARSVHDDSPELEITRQVFEQLPLRWTWGFNLTQGRPVLIPFNWFFTINEFNGPSAGNCNEEALVQGISEVVERHVSSLISRQRLPIPAIDPRSVSDATVRELLDKFQRAGIVLHLSDFTLGMGISTVGALAWDPATFPKRSEIVWTAGTAPDPQKALSRALTEVAQLAGDFNSSANYVASGLPKFRRIAEADFIVRPVQSMPISALPNIASDNMRLEVENAIAALSDRKMDVIVVDVRHPQLDIPAFYTIVPGAHFRERAAGTSLGLFSAKLIAESLPQTQAMAMLSDFDRRLPGKYYLKFYLGSLLLAAGQPAEAAHALEHALALAPNSQDIPSIYSYLGIALKEQGHYRPALKALEKGLALDSERTDILNLMGFCHFKLKEHEQAIARFRDVLALTPGSAIDLANIGINFRELGEKEQAIEHFRLALAIDPAIDFAREALARLGESGKN